MVETITTFLTEYIGAEWIVFFISLLPILELRGGLIAASLLGVPWYWAMVIGIIGTSIPVPFIIFFIQRILAFLKDHGPIKKFARWIENKGMRKGRELMEKHPRRIQLGLFLFVAIPIPGTGAWTGSLVAALMGIPPKKSAPALIAGVLGSAVIMAIISYAIPALFF